MSSNLTNTYANLRKNFQAIDMIFSKPVSYLKTLSGSDFAQEKIVLCFSEDLSKIRSHSSFNNSTTSEKSAINLNLTGSPLKDDLSIEDLINTSIASKLFLSKPWKDVEESYTPVDISEARKIIMNANKDCSGWVCVLCASGDGTFLLSCNGMTRGIAKYYGTVKHHEKSIDNLKARHYSLISPHAKLEITSESFFEITPDITLKFLNSSFSKSQSIDHIDEISEVVLYQKVEVGRCHVLCEDFWSQIQLLNMIKSDILNSPDDPTYSYGSSDMNFEVLQERVSKILSEVSIVNESETTSQAGLEDVLKLIHQRPLTEITDQLWDLLKFTSSYSDLRKIITFIFQVASRSNIVNIPTNSNRLGELIRELCQQRLAIPHLVGTQPLELLLEIGIEKLMKDYEFIFSESRICKLSEMKFGKEKTRGKSDCGLNVRKSISGGIDINVGSNRKTLLKSGSLEATVDSDDVQNSRFNEREVEVNIAKLAQIHLAVEHLLLIQNNLMIDNDYSSIIKKLFEKPLISIEELQQQKFDKFEFPISDKKVIHLVDQLIPNAQKITLQSENKFKKVKSVFYYNIEQIIPFLSIKKEVSSDSFHFINYTTIASKF